MSLVYNLQSSQESKQIILNEKENGFQETLFSRVLNLVQICCVLHTLDPTQRSVLSFLAPALQVSRSS